MSMTDQAGALPLHRRDFLVMAGLAMGSTGAVMPASAAVRGAVAIALDMHDPVLASKPVAWAVNRLRAALVAKGVTADLAGPSQAMHTITIAHIAAGAEDVRLSSPTPAQTLVASGGTRGLVYGLLELAERVEASGDPLVALHVVEPVAEQPASRVRSVLRAFCSKVEDPVWFYDRQGWSRYLDLLVASRFNRVQLAFGFGWDFPQGVTEDYFHFVYPYLLDVPGYSVRVEPLAPGERERNMNMLRFVTREAGLRGLDFQLGIWTHAYQWVDSPEAQHHVVGLTPQNHAAYCRDALAILLRECPEITGVSMRVHGESGIPEGQYDFWRTLFQAIAQCPRPMEIDMHAKGINQIMIDMAAATGKAVKVSPKFSAEHQGLGYHQADIRAQEIPNPLEDESGVFNQSNGPRRFTRYGYADLYQEGRKFDILHRRWPGTQRHTLNADPAQAAAYGRAAGFCNSAGLEICEPLTFKGRNNSGRPWGRLAYIDKSLEPEGGDWSKFAHSYRLWGRTLYNPDARPEAWRRHLQAEFGPAAQPLERALGDASRILLLFTTSHCYTPSNRLSLYEIYTNLPIVIGSEPAYEKDTPSPYCSGTVSALDPQLFSSARDHAHDLLSGTVSARYSPVETAAWMEQWATSAASALDQARAVLGGKITPAFRRWEEDILIQIALGKFFADRFRATVLYELYLITGDAAAGAQAIARYTAARDAWAAMAERAKTVYQPDISYGAPDFERMHWVARIPAFDRDLEAMRNAVMQGKDSRPSHNPVVRAAVAAATSTAPRWSAACQHRPAAHFRPGADLAIEVAAAAPVEAVELWYRHVNHGERWQKAPMQRQGQSFRAAIPGAYTQSPYPLQYYFVVTGQAAQPVFSPAFNETLSNQPYFVIWQRA
jgi:hypothetical protein